MRRFLEILLLPVARFCVRQGISLAEVNDALKGALLTAATHNLSQAKEPVTASRLSVMTGVHRKDTSKFLKGTTPQRDVVSPAIKVLGCWHTKKRYLKADGKPKALSIGSEESEFARLVREVSADVHPYTVLCELERLGLVRISDDAASPLKSSFVSAMDDEKTARIIARDIDELMSTAEENVSSKSPRPHHHTTTIFDNIPKEYESELRAWINREASLLHQKVRLHVAQYDRDVSEKPLRDSAKGTIRVAFGSFGRVCEKERKEDEGDTGANE